MKRFLFDCGTRDATASLGLLVLRVATGLMMLIGHGIPKIQKFDLMVKGWYVPDFFPLRYMSPQVSLIATIGAEVVASGLIVIGLMTRPAAFLLGFAMVVAAFGLHGGDTWFTGAGPRAKELALMYLIPAVVILLTGAGSFSADAALHKEGKRRRW